MQSQTYNKESLISSLYSRIINTITSTGNYAVNFIKSPTNISFLLIYLTSVIFGPYIHLVLPLDESGIKTLQAGLALIAAPPVRSIILAAPKFVVNAVADPLENSVSFVSCIIAMLAAAVYIVDLPPEVTKDSYRVTNIIAGLMGNIKQYGTKPFEAIYSSLIYVIDGLGLGLSKIAEPPAAIVRDFLKRMLFNFYSKENIIEFFTGMLKGYGELKGITESAWASRESLQDFYGKILDVYTDPKAWEKAVVRASTEKRWNEIIENYKKVEKETAAKIINNKDQTFIETLFEFAKDIRQRASAWFAKVVDDFPATRDFFGNNAKIIAFILSMVVAGIVVYYLVKLYASKKVGPPTKKIDDKIGKNFMDFFTINDIVNNYIVSQYDYLYNDRPPRETMISNSQKSSQILRMLESMEKDKYTTTMIVIFKKLRVEQDIGGYATSFIKAIGEINETTSDKLNDILLIGDESMIERISAVRGKMLVNFQMFSMLVGRITGLEKMNV